jgi:hypothetical protein
MSVHMVLELWIEQGHRPSCRPWKLTNSPLD